MARLIAAVHLTDPKTRRPVVLQPGEEPAPHLAALITNESAWEDGVLPDLADTAEDDGEGEGHDGAGPDPDAEAATTEPTPENTQDEPAAPAEEKPARKTASRKPAAN